MKNRIQTLLLAVMLSVPFMSSAQSVDSVLRSEGRIYVVVAVLLIILLGLFLYLFRLERKIRKLEKD
jgi:Na+-driven multidrug efflux pump